MGKVDTWMPLYVGKYMGATVHLTTEQHGAYFLLLLSAWKRGGWLHDDDGQLASTCKLTPAAWRRVRPIMAEFFEIEDGRWTQERVATEVAKTASVSAARSEAGKLGGRPRKQPESKPKAIAFVEPKQNETQPQPPTPDGVRKDADASSVGSDEPMPNKSGPKGEPWLKDETFLLAWSLCTEESRARSSRKASWDGWRRNPARPDTKLNALRTYLAHDPDVKRTGGPGFHLWIRDKLDEWMAKADGAPTAQAPTWNGPDEVLQAIRRSLGDPTYAERYLQSCTYRELPERILITASETIFARLQPCRKALLAIGWKLALERERAA